MLSILYAKARALFGRLLFHDMETRWVPALPRPAAVRKQILVFCRRPFIRNVAAVAGGTALSQVVAMAFSPLIARLYGPEAYGLQGVFISITGVMGSIAAMTYPVAIVLPKSDADAIGLARLSIYVGIGTSVLLTAILFLFGPEILLLVKATKISHFMYLIPAFMFASVLSTVAGQWLIRKKAFTETAKVTVSQALIINMIKAGFGLARPTAAVLVFTNTFGAFLTAGMMFFGIRTHARRQKEEILQEARSSMWTLAKRHRDFPLFRAPQVLLNSVSQSLPIIMLAANFGPASAGLYSIASAVLGIPTVLIGGAVMQVFYPRINEAMHHGEDVTSLIIGATVGLALSGALPFVVIIMAGPMLFGFVFGSQWIVAGTYAQWLSMWIFFQYINKPAVAAIPALGLQRGLLFYELVSTSSKVLALYIGYIVFESDVVAIALYSVFGTLAYAWLILWVISHSKMMATELKSCGKQNGLSKAS
jgi:O-antigen/teichoic acid export membrane protein